MTLTQPLSTLNSTHYEVKSHLPPAAPGHMQGLKDGQNENENLLELISSSQADINLKEIILISS